MSRYKLILSLGAALLTACGGTQQPIYVAGRVASEPDGRAAHNHRKSWMLPEASGEDLLYIANYKAGSVNVYSYKTLKLVGMLSGLNGPNGECTDRTGNVYIVNSRSDSIVEYPHGGTSPIATIDDYPYYPNDCGIDSTTGDLCVANLDATPLYGNLAIYKKARGMPSLYSDQNPYIAYYFSCAYDPDGNAYVDASFVDGGLIYDELAVGAKKLTRFRLGRAARHGGTLRWDGRYMAVNDGGNRVRRFDIGSRERAYHDGQTILRTSVGGISKFWVYAKGRSREIIGTVQTKNEIQIWTYPAGSSLHILDSGFDEPDGVTVSVAPR